MSTEQEAKNLINNVRSGLSDAQQAIEKKKRSLGWFLGGLTASGAGVVVTSISASASTGGATLLACGLAVASFSGYRAAKNAKIEKEGIARASKELSKLGGSEKDQELASDLLLDATDEVEKKVRKSMPEPKK